ncbi:MAG: GGDEF domain-containing protein [Gallionellales bacterium 35-53-114]|jgi:diguanylate cyclase|nr:MAG: GGDEF domain-containing protein [Gallionellales bacterium 35-53-114]OYZ64195.1 MAG: GGDEF domain-containing protein [Gallionellales bacterium 24-53-125]OZB10495.1 MAG: GGDEF domain-containing protein [Gallionellales bacterium 39-52-133]HQS57114.1 GGDEF domain-containing protein [Gallionellaceae bacterium]HQS74698.1 GGDEF domain-containing protein [Gallionellaceae bacterium]
MATPSSPSEIARETLKALAARKLPPTPDNYAQAYQEISGTEQMPSGATAVLENIAQLLAEKSPETAASGKTLKQAVSAQNWENCQHELQNLLLQTTEKSPSKIKGGQPTELSWPNLIRDLLRQLDIPHKGITLTRKKEGIETVLSRFTSDAVVLHEKLQSLVRSWSGTTSAPNETLAVADNIAPLAAPGTDKPMATTPGGSHALLVQLRELLAHTLENTQYTQPELGAEIQALAQQARAAENSRQITDLANQLRKFWLKLELRGGDKVKIQEGLLRLLRLLVENVSELVADDKWMLGQITTLKDIIEQPLDKNSIADAERNLRNAIIKQSNLKQSLSDAKITLKSLMTTFIDRLGDLTESTGDYHTKIEGYSLKIGGADNITELSHILADIMQDTRIIQASALRTHEELLSTRKQANEAEERVRKLEQELEEVSEMVREDQLTGALNRRGMEETLEREFKRSNREHALLSVGLIDIDNFKQLNDTLGHQGGDEALVHLTHVIKEALRPSDSVARYGGEEFLIILPNTGIEEAIETLERLQRELTKKFFMHNNERKLITFSAGVALRMENEDKEDLIGRADKAMYQAKQTGKNRVVAAA